MGDCDFVCGWRKEIIDRLVVGVVGFVGVDPVGEDDEDGKMR